MYQCRRCKAVFSEPEYNEVCYERECGVSSLFSTRHYRTECVCPECGSRRIEEYDEEDEEDEL